MKAILDRFEDEFAVCEKEDLTMINISKSKLPPEAKEGDVLIIDNERICVDSVETEKRKKEIERMTKNLWK